MKDVDIYLAQPVPFFLLLSTPCCFFHMFISRSCHLYSYISSSVAGGWLRLTSLTPNVCVCVCVCVLLLGGGGVSACVCLRTRQHSVYFQSILFKDQTRAWWLISLFPAFFHLLWKMREGRGGKRGEVRLPHSPGITSTSPPRTLYPPPSSSLGGLAMTLRRAPRRRLFSLG